MNVSSSALERFVKGLLLLVLFGIALVTASLFQGFASGPVLVAAALAPGALAIRLENSARELAGEVRRRRRFAARLSILVAFLMAGAGSLLALDGARTAVVTAALGAAAIAVGVAHAKSTGVSAASVANRALFVGGATAAIHTLTVESHAAGIPGLVGLYCAIASVLLWSRDGCFLLGDAFPRLQRRLRVVANWAFAVLIITLGEGTDRARVVVAAIFIGYCVSALVGSAVMMEVRRPAFLDVRARTLGRDVSLALAAIVFIGFVVPAATVGAPWLLIPGPLFVCVCVLWDLVVLVRITARSPARNVTPCHCGVLDDRLAEIDACLAPLGMVRGHEQDWSEVHRYRGRSGSPLTVGVYGRGPAVEVYLWTRAGSFNVYTANRSLNPFHDAITMHPSDVVLVAASTPFTAMLERHRQRVANVVAEAGCGAVASVPTHANGDFDPYLSWRDVRRACVRALAWTGRRPTSFAGPDARALVSRLGRES